jgi:hypothetical protein
MKKIILLVIPFLTLLYSVDALFLDIHFDYQVNPVFTEEDSLPETEVSDYKVKMGNGLVQIISKMVYTLDEIRDPDLPVDGEMEKTIDRLERFLLSKEISLSLHLFVLALSLATFFAVKKRAWFALLIGRSLFFFTFLLAGINVLRSILHMRFILLPGILGFCFHFTVLGLTIFAFFAIKKYLEQENTYANLYIASVTSEDSNTGKIALPFEKKAITGSLLFWGKIIMHFSVIILIGILLGNLVYIPLFSLQKHYVKEFGLLIGFSLVLLSVFYIRNYYYIGRESDKTLGENLAVSYSFLVYRFLRNFFMIAITTLGVILFVITLLLILNYNISILIDKDIIERTISL